LVVKSFDNKEQQADAIDSYWNIYNAKPDENLSYTGTSQGYIPVVRDAINARAKRVLKQLFAQNGKHVDAITEDANPPYTQISLIEHYIRKTDLRDIVRSVLIAGDVTGQWCLSLDWTKNTRMITNLVRRNPIVESIGGEDVSALGIEDPEDEEEELEEKELTEEGPEVVDFSVQDIAVVPPTCTDLQKAKLVAMRVRFSAEELRQKIDEGVFILPAGTAIEDFVNAPDKRADRHNPAKQQTNDAGVKTEGTTKFALVYACYGKLAFEKGEPKREAIVFFSSKNEIIGLIENPLWSGKRPIICKPVERLQGSFFGKSKVEAVKFMQWQLCDIHNIGIDSAYYSMLPVFAANPTNNPNWAALVAGVGAVWPIAPDDIKKIEFGTLWKDALTLVEAIKKQIQESLGVNEMMMGMMPKGRKNAQMVGAMAQEQSTEVTDHALRFEEEVLNPLVEFLFELDQQYRTKPLLIETRGMIGYKASIEEIPVQQWGERYLFRWIGTETMQNMQRIQQQIGFMNVLKGTPPQMLGGRRIDISPIIVRAVEALFSPEDASKILIDERNLYSVDPEMENEMIFNGQDVMVHQNDDDPKHLQSHMAAAAKNGDPRGLYLYHMTRHHQQLEQKRQKQEGEAQAKGLPGSPGGLSPTGQPAPGVGGTPRPGSLPAPQRPGQNPPGAIPADQMADPNAARG
jgi:23S rRNA U2552 (ribose-2'-O)-methylase RlmE/FtsJ